MFDFGPFGGSDPFFPWMEAVGPILFFVVFAVIAVVIVRGIVRWFRNNAAPVLTVPARVVNLRMKVTGDAFMNDGILRDTTSTSYYATFEVESGDRMELSVDGRAYGLLAQGDIGSLTFQGTRYLGFQRR